MDKTKKKAHGLLKMIKQAILIWDNLWGKKTEMYALNRFWKAIYDHLAFEYSFL